MTYSIVARDPETGTVGVASQSHCFGLGRVVPWAPAGIGVVATQSFVLPSYGSDGLAKMRAGTSAAMRVAGAQVGARSWDNVLVVVRLDDHVAPLTELRRLVRLDRANRVPAESVFTPGLLSGAAAVTGTELEAVVGALDAAQAAIGDDPETTLWKSVLHAPRRRAGIRPCRYGLGAGAPPVDALVPAWADRERYRPGGLRVGASR
jgi:uncharacterized Ntn-hydrolase superfamily protein